MDTEFEALLAAAGLWIENATPEQKAEMWNEQRRSYVRGELMMSHPEMTFEEADRRVREAEEYLT